MKLACPALCCLRHFNLKCFQVHLQGMQTDVKTRGQKNSSKFTSFRGTDSKWIRNEPVEERLHCSSVTNSTKRSHVISVTLFRGEDWFYMTVQNTNLVYKEIWIDDTTGGQQRVKRSLNSVWLIKMTFKLSDVVLSRDLKSSPHTLFLMDMKWCFKWLSYTTCQIEQRQRWSSECWKCKIHLRE